MMMNFELLPNEIFLDLFDYFNGIDILRAFFGLNFRFNYLLYNQFRNYHFKFNSISKCYFDMICQQHLPFITNRIIALRLSDFDDTPGQVDLFLSYVPSFNQFTHLRSLTVVSVDSYNTLLKMLDVCHQLCNLTHLNFCLCYIRDTKADFQIIINDIWNLPKLLHCNFGIDFQRQRTFCLPTIISTSIQSVNISSKNTVKLYQINRLFDYTPCLKRLSMCIDCYANENDIVSPLPTLIDLNITSFYLSNISKIIILLQNMPNLCRLKINLTSDLIDGQQWEHIIRNYLPKLKVFQLTMKKIFFIHRIMEIRIDELINSFRSSFWIDKHQWFVRCLTQGKTVYLHTTNDFEEILYDSWRSTYPFDNQEELCINKTSIYDETFFERSIPSHVHLSNIKTLWIKFPINDQFWSIVPNLNQLYSLRVSYYTDTFQSQFQALLDRVPHLRYLTVYQAASSPCLQMSLFKNISASVRRLNLISYNHCFDGDECMILARSPLAIQCEVLSILVNNCECIIKLVENMAHLQALNVRCQDEKYHEQLALAEDDNGKMVIGDETVQWLKDRLPSTCFILRNPDSVKDISIWIQ